MILITSAKYVNPELQVEFGKIPPAFLPLGSKRLYEHQKKLFQNRNEKIVLSLPESYQVTKADLHKLSELNIEIIFVTDGLSLGESIVFVLNMLLPIDEHLSILHGDTLFLNLDDGYLDNRLEISKADTSYNWEYVVQKNRIIFDSDLYEPTTLKEYVVSGYFNFKDIYVWIKCLTKCKFSFIEAIKLYGQENKVKLVKNDTWLDFGLAATYFHSRQSFTTERAFNSLTIKDGYVLKCSEKKGKLQSEIKWYENLPQALSLYIPRFEVSDNGLCYKTEYLYLNTLSELYVYGNLPQYVWKQIFLSVKDFLTNMHSYSENNIEVNFDYKMKTLSRMEEFSGTKHIDLDKTWVMNGFPLPSINKIIEELDKYIDNSNNYSFIHGDFCMSNIMYDFKSNRVKVYDPRGMDFDNTVTQYGKGEYDYVKLMHSVFGLYDFIISGFYSLEYADNKISFIVENPPELMLIQEAYREVIVMDDFKSAYAVMIHLFLSMLPLHSDDETRQFALLANAFRLYLELERIE